MAKNAFKTDGFYFSYSFDITHSIQRLHNTSNDFQQLPLHERVSVSKINYVLFLDIKVCLAAGFPSISKNYLLQMITK